MGWIDPTMLNPNILYLGLLLGLWVAVTAAYVPGTVVAEVIAFVVVVGSLFVLSTVATNWLAVLALVLGVAAFLLMPFLGDNFRRYGELGLVFQALGGYFLFEEMQVSPILIAVTILLAVAYNRMVLLPIIRSHQANKGSLDVDDVLGKQGRVVKELNPVGTVYVNHELWRARSDDFIGTDALVTVIGQDGLELKVEKRKHDDEIGA